MPRMLHSCLAQPTRLTKLIVEVSSALDTRKVRTHGHRLGIVTIGHAHTAARYYDATPVVRTSDELDSGSHTATRG